MPLFCLSTLALPHPGSVLAKTWTSVRVRDLVTDLVTSRVFQKPQRVPFTLVPLRPRAAAQDESENAWGLEVRYDLSGDDIRAGQGVVDIDFPGCRYVRKVDPWPAETPEASFSSLEFSNQ